MIDPVSTPRGRGLQQLSAALGVPLIGGEARYPGQRWLNWLKTPLEVVGPYPGRILRIYHYTVGSGTSSKRYCAIRVGVKNTRRRRFSISGESAVSRMGKAPGMRDAETGDPRFNDRSFLRGDDPGFFKIALVESIRLKLLDLDAGEGGFGRFSLNQEDLLYAEAGEIQDDARIDRFIKAAAILVELADAWEIYSGVSP